MPTDPLATALTADLFAAEAAPASIPEQGELFLCDIVNWPVKDDMASMEVPIFSLAKQKDTQERTYKRGDRYVKIMPSSVGAATVFDKDLLLYVASQIIEAQRSGKPVSRTVKINSIDFLQGTERGDGRASFERILDMLRRLRGTTIETNIPTHGQVQTTGFSLIDSYQVLSAKARPGESANPAEEETVARVLCFSVTLSDWLYNSLLNYEVLTLDRQYFALKRSIDRRLYEIARKHCGDQALWKINIDLLAEKVGTRQGERYRFREDLRLAIAADVIPEYHLALDTAKSPDDVVFYTRTPAKLAAEIQRAGIHAWFQALERRNNVALWRKAKISIQKSPAATP